jgi:hypothetical protein
MVFMNTGRKFSGISCLLAAALLVCGAAGAQSLGDQARRLRARTGPPAKPERVYTNDNMPRTGGLSTTAVEAPKEKGKEGEKAAPAAQSQKAMAELEKDYRAKAAPLRAALEAEQKKWDELQKQWGLGRQQETERQKAALDAARKALDDLEDELRRKVLPASWAR